MENDIKEIKEKIEEFMKKYNATVKIEAVDINRTFDGKLVNPRAMFIISG